MPPEEAVIALSEGGFHLLPAGSPGAAPRLVVPRTTHRPGPGTVSPDVRPGDHRHAAGPSRGRRPEPGPLGRRGDHGHPLRREPLPLVERARKRLISAGIPILKTVVNGVKTSRFGSGSRLRVWLQLRLRRLRRVRLRRAKRRHSFAEDFAGRRIYRRGRGSRSARVASGLIRRRANTGGRPC